MDAVTANVVWLVIWFILIWVPIPVTVFIFGLIGVAIDDGNPLSTAVSVLLGWLVGATVAIFSVVQVILHIISLVQLLAT